MIDNLNNSLDTTADENENRRIYLESLEKTTVRRTSHETFSISPLIEDLFLSHVSSSNDLILTIRGCAESIRQEIEKLNVDPVQNKKRIDTLEKRYINILRNLLKAYDTRQKTIDAYIKTGVAAGYEVEAVLEY